MVSAQFSSNVMYVSDTNLFNINYEANIGGQLVHLLKLCMI